LRLTVITVFFYSFQREILIGWIFLFLIYIGSTEIAYLYRDHRQLKDALGAQLAPMTGEIISRVGPPEPMNGLREDNGVSSAEMVLGEPLIIDMSRKEDAVQIWKHINDHRTNFPI
jgi:hypothetical protein